MTLTTETPRMGGERRCKANASRESVDSRRIFRASASTRSPWLAVDSAPPCKLCGGKGTRLEPSLPIPKWAELRVRARGWQTSDPVIVSNGRVTHTSSHAAKAVFCRACEERCSPHERYVAQLCWQENEESLPLLASATDGVTFGAMRCVELPALDTKSLAYFAASVVYRASVAGGVSASFKRHDESLRRYLLNETSFPEDARCLVAALDPFDRESRPYLRLVSAPSSHAVAGGVVFGFALFGITFQLFMGDALNPLLSQLCIARGNHARALVVPWNSCRAFLQTGEVVVKAGAPRKRK